MSCSMRRRGRRAGVEHRPVCNRGGVRMVSYPALPPALKQILDRDRGLIDIWTWGHAAPSIVAHGSWARPR